MHRAAASESDSASSATVAIKRADTAFAAVVAATRPTAGLKVRRATFITDVVRFGVCSLRRVYRTASILYLSRLDTAGSGGGSTINADGRCGAPETSKGREESSHRHCRHSAFVIRRARAVAVCATRIDSSGVYICRPLAGLVVAHFPQ